MVAIVSSRQQRRWDVGMWPPDSTELALYVLPRQFIWCIPMILAFEKLPAFIKCPNIFTHLSQMTLTLLLSQNRNFSSSFLVPFFSLENIILISRFLCCWSKPNRTKNNRHLMTWSKKQMLPRLTTGRFYINRTLTLLSFQNKTPDFSFVFCCFTRWVAVCWSIDPHSRKTAECSW